MLPLLKDADAEVRAQTVKVLGDAGYTAAHATVVTLLRDKSARVRAQAAIAPSKLDQGAGDALIRLIAENNGNDPVVHHATILPSPARSSAGDLVKLNARKPAAIRTAAVVALRRQRSGDVATFLNDGNALVQLEAARAIADEHIDSAMPQLARLAKRTDLAKPVMRRALNANYRLANAEVLAAVAADSNQAELARAEALNLLAAWENPSGRDRITGLWRPIAKRDNSAAVAALDGKIDSILRASEGIVRSEAIATASKLKLKSAGPALFAVLKDEKAGSARAAALRALGEIESAELADAVAYGNSAKDTNIRSAATRLAAKVKPTGATGALESTLAKGSVSEQQSALVALGELKNDAADKVLAAWLDKLLADNVPAALKLELLEAAAKRSDDAVKSRWPSSTKADPIHARISSHSSPTPRHSEGGNAARGKKVFFENVALSCARCHVVGGQGGEVGPALDGIGAKVDRDYLLESIVNPNATIAKGYDFFLITLKNGQGYAGIIKSETDKEVVINSPEDGIVTVKTADIKERIKGPSGMPPGLQLVATKTNCATS